MNFGGNPLYQATKQHLNNSKMVKNKMEIEDICLVLVELCCFHVQCAWKNIGISFFHHFLSFDLVLSVVFVA